MSRLVLAAVTAVAAVAALPRAAAACPEVLTFGAFEADPPEPISSPIVIAGIGATSDGWGGSVAAGWTWGARQGWLFRGANLHRVMIQIQRPFTSDASPDASARGETGGGAGVAMDSGPPTRVAVTYGWFDNALFDLGLDVGVAATEDRAGPLAQLSVGSHGLGLRLSGGLDIGSGDTRFSGAAELVVDLAAVIGRY